MNRTVPSFVATILTIILMFSSNISFADDQGWKFAPDKKNANNEFNKRLPLPFEDDITQDQKIDQIQLTTDQKHEALVWELSELEEKRYVLLMKNKSSLYYKHENVSPVEILGINSRTNEERSHYAEKAATQEFQRLAKFFAFNAAYNQKAEALKEKLDLSVVRKFDYAPFSPYNYQPVDLVEGDQLMLFVEMETHVRSIVGALLDEMVKKKSVYLNIYFIGKNISKDTIQQWAKQQNLPISLVKSGQLTLNLDGHKFKKLKTDRKFPVLVLIRSGISHFVDMSRF